MRLSVSRRITAGVQVRAGVAAHPGLGCAAPVDSDDALEWGLVSQRAALEIAGRRLTLPPWGTSTAIALPPGTGAAILATLRHQASGMSPLLVAATAALLGGLVSASAGLVAPAALALLLLGSVLVHELGHVVAYRVLFGGTAPALVVVRGASCHVVRRADDSWADVAVVVAGGAAPGVLALATLPLVGVVPSAVLLGGLVAIGHLAALALPFGDGVSLRDIRSARRRGGAGARVTPGSAPSTAAAASTRRRIRPRGGS